MSDVLMSKMKEASDPKLGRLQRPHGLVGG